MSSDLVKSSKRIILLLCLGLLVRFVAIPFSSPTEADAVSRVFSAWCLLLDPEIITHGVWAPLHFYLIAGAMLIWKDPVLTPILLNIFFSVATVIPLYFFVKREWGETASLYISSTYLFYPLAVRNSLMAVSEVPFVFFLTLSLVTISLARSSKGCWQHALAAGLFLTLAGGIRYEAWALIPLMGLLLWKKRTLLFVFLLSSALFPFYWMLGNHIHYGDALYSVHWATHWQVNIEGINDGLTIHQIINRITYYPKALFFGLTPLVSAVCLLGIALSVIRRKKQCVWLIPLTGLFIIFLVKAVNGSLLLRGRYSLVLGLLIFPFAAETINSFHGVRRKLPIALIIIASMIPLSFAKDFLPWSIASHIPNDIQVVPRVGERAKSISAELTKQNGLVDEGLILDFFGWKDTYYVALMARKNPAKIFFMPGGRQQSLNLKGLSYFLDKNKTGFILRTENSRHVQFEGTHQRNLLKIDGLNRSLFVEELSEVEGTTFYRYRTED